MTVQEEVRQRIERDPLLARLRQKIESGKASYTDTAAYSIRAGKLLGEIFSRRLPEIPPEEREQLCVDLLHDRYIDINAAVDAVQCFMDEAQGLHLAPQHAPFDAERGHQIGSSLRDLSKPVETLQRRARAAAETATKSMHDDRMKTEARFRSRAGLQCYITRKAVNGCCPWCTAVAGRYAYGEEPDGIYRRHDNCDCTVTFENGRKRQDVWSKREWEVPEEDAGAPEPVRFTAEQAEELQYRIGSYPLRGSSEMRFGRLNGSRAISSSLAEEYRTEYDKFTEMFGELSSLKGVDIAPYADDGVYGEFYPQSRTIVIFGVDGKNGDKFLIVSSQSHKESGEWSTGSKYHSFRHELGHALQMEHSLNDTNWEKKINEIENIRQSIVSDLTNPDGSVKIKEMAKKLSKYGFVNTDEFISEAVAEFFQNPKKARSTSKKVVEIIMRGDEYYAG